jgi:flagellar biosynthetic protein FliO
MGVAPDHAYRHSAWSCLLLNATNQRCAARRMLYAVSATPFAAPMQQAAPGTAGGLLRVVIALIVVLAAVLAAAWLARRMRAFSGGGSSSHIEMLAQLPLGTRERAVLVRVGDCQVLIGVAPGNVRTLHVLRSASADDTRANAARGVAAPVNGLPSQSPPAAASDSPQAAPAHQGAARPSFKALLLRSLGK